MESFVKNIEHAHKENGDSIVGLLGIESLDADQREPVSGMWVVLG